jgi:hypothetical protein
MAKDGDRSGDHGSKDAKRLRKHLKRLRGQLTAASKAEAKRLRKLEKARWRRQRIEAFLDEVQAIAEMETAPVAPPPATPSAAAAPRPVRAARPAAGTRKPGPASPEKPVR